MMLDISNMTEDDFAKSAPPECKTLEELQQLLTQLEQRQHDYGTCVYAVSWAALASFNYMASKLGITGFQASCADLNILKHTRSLEDGFMITDYNKLFYPQYYHNPENFPSAKALLTKLRKAPEMAKAKLGKHDNFHPDVKKHLEDIAAGNIP